MTQHSPSAPRGPVLRLAWLYGAHMLRYLIPLSTIPYLTRVLGPAQFGTLLFVQAYAGFSSQLVEYGFGISKVRDVALAREQPVQMATIVAGVFGAQALLLAGVTAITLVACALTSELGSQSRLLSLAMLAATLQAVQPGWLLRGMEQPERVARADMLARVLRAAAVFALVRSERDAWLVCAGDAVASAIAVAWLLPAVQRVASWRMPTFALARRTLGESRDAFAMRAGTNLFTAGTNFVLGLLATPSAVATFGGAEKLFAAARSLSAPVVDVLLPIVVRDGARAPIETKRRLWTYWVRSQLVALPVTAVLFLAAPALLRLLLGPGFEGAVTCFRILFLTLPMVVTNLIYGNLWLYALGYDRLCAWIGLGGGMIAVVGTALACANADLLPADVGAAVAYALGLSAMAAAFARLAGTAAPSSRLGSHG